MKLIQLTTPYFENSHLCIESLIWRRQGRLQVILSYGRVSDGAFVQDGSVPLRVTPDLKSSVSTAILAGEEALLTLISTGDEFPGTVVELG